LTSCPALKWNRYPQVGVGVVLALKVQVVGGTPTRVGDALAHYGRIFKTLHVLSYVANEPYRRQIKAMRNSKKAVTNWPDASSTAVRATYVRPTAKAWRTRWAPSAWSSTPSPAWNTIYLNDILDTLRADGHHIDPADQARLSAYIRTHINFDGHYAFTLPNPDSARRPLRDPNEPDDQ
jgi:hypothetical protein